MPAPAFTQSDSAEEAHPCVDCSDGSSGGNNGNSGGGSSSGNSGSGSPPASNGISDVIPRGEQQLQGGDVGGGGVFDKISVANPDRLTSINISQHWGAVGLMMLIAVTLVATASIYQAGSWSRTWAAVDNDSSTESDESDERSNQVNVDPRQLRIGLVA